jgi:hypothetical protein
VSRALAGIRAAGWRRALAYAVAYAGLAAYVLFTLWVVSR